MLVANYVGGKQGQSVELTEAKCIKNSFTEARTYNHYNIPLDVTCIKRNISLNDFKNKGGKQNTQDTMKCD